jgi:hypothetical protein
MGQPEWERQNKTARTELTEQDCQHRAAKKKTARTRQKGDNSRKDSQNRTAR